VTVTVTDNGPGIAPAVRDRLFEPFAPGPGSTTTGVGLAICKAVVVAHGGTIAVTDPLDGGACFVFTLPISS
jgi:signal transduction histidine kinase